MKALAKSVGLTESHFCRVFKKVEGLTVGEYRGLVQGRKEGGQLVMGAANGVGADKIASFSTLTPVENEVWDGNFHDPMTVTENFLLPWDSTEISGIMDEIVDCDFSTIQVDFGTAPFDFSPKENRPEVRREEECFEFLDFGSPQPVAVFV